MLTSRAVPMKWLRAAIMIVVLLISALSFTSLLKTRTVRAATTAYVFTTFRGDAAPDEKLWVYTSPDGLSFSLYSNTGFGGPTGVLRDPSVMKHTDGKYYIAFTVQSWTTSSTYFAIASSTNLINWTNVATVNAGVSGTYFTWAPEWYIEGGTVRIIVSLGPQGSNFRPYIFTAQNSALTSWSGPVDMGIGTNHIDTFVVKSGSTYHAFVKDETSKYIEHATSSSLTGPWNWVGTGNWSGWGSGYEAPAVVQHDNGTWRIYIDRYTNGGIWSATSSNLNSWSGLSLVGQYRHGTVLKDTNFTGNLPTYYRITNRNSGKVVDVQNPNTSNGARIGQYAWNGGNWQQWQFVDVGGGYFNLVSRHSGKCLDVSGVSTADGANIIQWTCGTGQNQQWQWSAIGSYFQLRARHSGKCLNVVGSSLNDGAFLEQRTCSSTNNAMQWSRQ